MGSTAEGTRLADNVVPERISIAPVLNVLAAKFRKHLRHRIAALSNGLEA